MKIFEKAHNISMKLATFSIFAFLLSFFVYSFESAEYETRKRQDTMLIEAVVDVGGDTLKYFGTFLVFEKEFIIEINKEMFEIFHNEGQKPLESYITVSKDEVNSKKPLILVISETIAKISAAFFPFALIVTLFASWRLKNS